MKLRILLLPLLIIAMTGCATKRHCEIGNCSNGAGTFHFGNGVWYEGEFKNGYLHGHGKKFWAKDHYIEGEFVEGKLIGPTIEYLEGGRILKFNLENGLRKGRGTMHSSDGTAYKLYYSSRGWISYGNWIYENGERYEGPFRSGDRKGYGILYSKNGSILKIGEWHEDSLVKTRSSWFVKNDMKERYIRAENEIAYRKEEEEKKLNKEAKALAYKQRVSPQIELLNKRLSNTLLGELTDKYIIKSAMSRKVHGGWGFGSCYSANKCHNEQQEWFKVGRKMHGKEIQSAVPNYAKLLKNITNTFPVNKEGFDAYIDQHSKSSDKIDAEIIRLYPYYDVDWDAINEVQERDKKRRWAREKAAEERKISEDFNREIMGYIASGKSYETTEAEKMLDDSHKIYSSIINDSIQRQHISEKRNARSGLALTSDSPKTDGGTIAKRDLSAYPAESHKNRKDCIAYKGTWVKSKRSCYGLGKLMELACKAKYSGTVSGLSPRSSSCSVYLGSGSKYDNYKTTNSYAGKVISTLLSVQWTKVKKVPIKNSNRSMGR